MKRRDTNLEQVSSLSMAWLFLINGMTGIMMHSSSIKCTRNSKWRFRWALADGQIPVIEVDCTKKPHSLYDTTSYSGIVVVAPPIAAAGGTLLAEA